MAAVNTLKKIGFNITAAEIPKCTWPQIVSAAEKDAYHSELILEQKDQYDPSILAQIAIEKKPSSTDYIIEKNKL